MDDDIERLDELTVDRIDPGEPKLENVLFVLLGVLATLAVIIDLANLVG